MDWTHLLFSFKGRIQRLYWWITSLVVSVVAGMASSTFEFAAQRAGSGMINPETQQFEPSGPFAIGLGVIAALNLWINFALSVKRLHDRDRTGWWLLMQALVLLVAVILMVVAFAVPEEQRTSWFVIGGIASVAAIGVSLWLFIEIGFLKGTAGPNRYGADPLGQSQPDAKL